MGVGPRLSRLLGADGRCFDVAVDHGFFNAGAFLSGIEDMQKSLRTLAQAGPDAIQVSPGQARVFQALPKPRPALVLRTDVANVYPTELPSMLYSEVIEDPVEAALRLDAACVVVNLLQLPDQPDLHRQCVRNVMLLRAECDHYGMPLMVEPLVMQANSVAGGYMVDGDIDKILPLVRQAVELGADVVKADPTDNITDYHRVIEIAGRVPVLVRGGGKVPVDEILRRTADLIAQGAAGIVYGRNVIQHPDPSGITRALMAVVHDGATPEAARRLVSE
jgi:DhnA family fructose-bisphosphate aldolase class Ia